MISMVWISSRVHITGKLSFQEAEVWASQQGMRFMAMRQVDFVQKYVTTESGSQINDGIPYKKSENVSINNFR